MKSSAEHRRRTRADIQEVEHPGGSTTYWSGPDEPTHSCGHVLSGKFTTIGVGVLRTTTHRNGWVSDGLISM
jgi:hypothetical protein